MQDILKYFFIVLLTLNSLYACKEDKKTIPAPAFFPSNEQVDTIPFAYGKEGRIIVNVIQDSLSLNYIFDTGAQQTVVSRGGKALNNIKTITDIRGKKHSSELVIIDNFKFGDINYSKHSFFQKILNGTDGIIGSDLLQKFAWKIDFLSNRFEVARDVSVFNLEQEPILLKMSDNWPMIKATVGNKEDWFVLDSGYSGFMRIKVNSLSFNNDSNGLWKAFRRSSSSDVFGIDSIGQTVFFKSKLDDVKIGLNTFKDEIIDFDINVPVNILGIDFLKRFSYVVIDFPGRSLYLGDKLYKTCKYLEDINIQFNTFGLQISSSEEHYSIITAIMPKIFGDEIHLGDTVTEINRQSLLLKDEQFYKDSIIQGNNFVKYQKSRFQELLDSFTYLQNTATIKVKDEQSYKTIELERIRNLNNIPDTVHSFNIKLGNPPIYKKGIKQQKDNGQYYLFITKDEIL